MKKLFGIAGILFAGLVLTACGSSKGDKIVCTAEGKDDQGKTQKVEVIAYLKDGKVSNAEESFTFETEEEAKQYYNIYQAFMTMGGVEIDMELDGKTFTIKDLAKLMETEGDEEEGSPKLIGMTKEEFIEYANSTREGQDVKFECK